MDTAHTSPDSLLSSLLSNPELLQNAFRLAERMKDALPNASTEVEGTEKEPTPPSLDGIAALLSSPELSERLPALLSSLMASAARSEASSTTEEAVKTSAAPHPPTTRVPRNDLLLSLKPFLSRERCEAIDMIIRLSTLGNILSKML